MNVFPVSGESLMVRGGIQYRSAPELPDKNEEIQKTRFDLDYETISELYNASDDNKINKIKFEFTNIIEKIKELKENKSTEFNKVIGKALCKYLDSKYDKIGSVNETERKCIIPVGLPGSGKSHLLKDLEDHEKYVICDADEIRDIIINAVLSTYFENDNTKSVKIPDDIENWKNVYPELIDIFRDYILFGNKSEDTNKEDKEDKCYKGIEPYCKPLFETIPQALDIFLLFCKYKKSNFIYDAANTDAEFRNNLMMRCYLVGNYTRFEIQLLITPLRIIKKNVATRNSNNIRQTTMDFVYTKLLGFFKIDQVLLQTIDQKPQISILLNFQKEEKPIKSRIKAIEEEKKAKEEANTEDIKKLELEAVNLDEKLQALRVEAVKILSKDDSEYIDLLKKNT